MKLFSEMLSCRLTTNTFSLEPGETALLIYSTAAQRQFLEDALCVEQPTFYRLAESNGRCIYQRVKELLDNSPHNSPLSISYELNEAAFPEYYVMTTCLSAHNLPPSSQYVFISAEHLASDRLIPYWPVLLVCFDFIVKISSRRNHNQYTYLQQAKN